MEKKNKKLQLIYLLYWLMLAYILAALIWWFIELNNQSHEMASLLNRIGDNNESSDIESWQKRKTAQYWGEGITFFLLIVTGAVFFFRAIRKQFKISQQQQNFMMAITHELKTPIAVSRLNLETIQKRNLDERNREKLMHNTIEELTRMNALSNNLLLSSQIDAGGYRLTMEPIDIGDLAKDLTNRFRERYPERKISCNVDENAAANADGFLLELLISNLIDNALKYSPKEKEIVVEANKINDDILLRVSDQGKGIPDQDKKRIFEKFFRTGNIATKEAKGTGLGLFLVKKIAEAHKGTAIVQDNPSGGSVFTITLPAAK